MQGKYANVIIDISHEKLDRLFQYKIPEELFGKMEPGTIVSIPFGKANRQMKGYILEVTDKAEYDEDKMKYLTGVITDSSLVESDLIRLAYWIKENYGATMIAALRTVLPVKKQMKPKEHFWVKLIMDEESANERLQFFEKKHQVARARLLKELQKEQVLDLEIITEKLTVSKATVKNLEDQGILQIFSGQVYRNPVKNNIALEEKKVLNIEQQKIADSILADYHAGIRQTCLIHGITGSGKTEVYLELIEEMIAEGKQAILLIPEIALTYQTVMRFYKRFGERVSTLHSRLSAGEKYDQFQRARRGELDVMIGPRSVLFTPFPNLGMIIMDEEHEGTYKSESVPKYHAREVAIRRGELASALVVLGSATPSVEAYYKAQKGEYRLYELNSRAGNGELPLVHTIDLREELEKGNRSIFSDVLRELITDRLQKKEQIMLFLNRRGYAGFVSCRKCGHVMKCPHCDVSLSVHGNGKLMCHYCGYEQMGVKICPECGSKYIGGMKAGTEQVEEIVRKQFPTARVLRMDMDTTRQKDSHENILSQFANQEADILIGTQMIVKGHDFPNVTLVGILAADMSLYASDYRAGERTFQLLTQAAGRAGRGAAKGEVVIQTYSPDHYSIITAANQDYAGFYAEEMAYRSIMEYPPSSHILAILIESKDKAEAAHIAKQIAEEANQPDSETAVHIIGPAEAGIGKINDIYRKMVYIKCESYGELTRRKDILEEYLEKENKQTTRVSFDFDPVHTY